MDIKFYIQKPQNKGYKFCLPTNEIKKNYYELEKKNVDLSKITRITLNVNEIKIKPILVEYYDAVADILHPGNVNIIINNIKKYEIRINSGEISDFILVIGYNERNCVTISSLDANSNWKEAIKVQTCEKFDPKSIFNLKKIEDTDPISEKAIKLWINKALTDFKIETVKYEYLINYNVYLSAKTPEITLPNEYKKIRYETKN